MLFFYIQVFIFQSVETDGLDQEDFDEEFEDFQVNTSIEANVDRSEDEDWDFKAAEGISFSPALSLRFWVKCVSFAW